MEGEVGGQGAVWGGLRAAQVRGLLLYNPSHHPRLHPWPWRPTSGPRGTPRRSSSCSELFLVAARITASCVGGKRPSEEVQWRLELARPCYGYRLRAS
jgi:hypothetical protein